MTRDLLNVINRKKSIFGLIIFLFYLIQNFNVNAKGLLGKINMEEESEIKEDINVVPLNIPSNCKNIQYFSNTFLKADKQLSNLMKKFLAHRELYDNLYSNIQVENSNSTNSQERLEKVNKKIKSLVDVYVEKIEDVRNSITKILSEIERDLSNECKEILVGSKNKVLEHITSALKELK
jgi:hypothetical protein